MGGIEDREGMRWLLIVQVADKEARWLVGGGLVQVGWDLGVSGYYLMYFIVFVIFVDICIILF